MTQTELDNIAAKIVDNHINLGYQDVPEGWGERLEDAIREIWIDRQMGY